VGRGILLSLTLSCLALAGGAPSWAAPADPPPPGANGFTCRPTAAHPNPVVLVHGYGSTMAWNWRYLSPLLAERGYCVFALTYGRDPRAPWFGGVRPIEESAPELGAFVDRVLDATGAEQVDLVGHSEGTFMPQYWLKILGGAPKVDRYVALTPLYDGTNAFGGATLRDAAKNAGLYDDDFAASFCGSCTQFQRGSDMVKLLSAGGAAAPGVTYTTVMTKYDVLVVPYTSGYLDDPDATNLVLQDLCPANVSDHAAVAVDPVVARIVFNALDPEHAAPVTCGGLHGQPAR
jgi:triacylglycerol esterase/lipase EstA (alpha/beta hydrolase family)